MTYLISVFSVYTKLETLSGNLFNMGINIIGTYVHAARLQYLEFFSKFYKEGGVPFNPLKYQTKYVDVTTDSGEVVE